jgi:isopropylmalate/homocitrate/citramalate synthase
MASQKVSGNPDKRLLQLHAEQNVRLMDQLMDSIRMDIQAVANNSKNLDEFQTRITFYTTVNCFTSEKYREQTQEVVDSINQVFKVNSK